MKNLVVGLLILTPFTSFAESLVDASPCRTFAVNYAKKLCAQEYSSCLNPKTKRAGANEAQKLAKYIVTLEFESADDFGDVQYEILTTYKTGDDGKLKCSIVKLK